MTERPHEGDPPGWLAGVPDWLRPRLLVAPIVAALGPFLVPEQWPSHWLDLHPALGAVVGVAASFWAQRVVARSRARTRGNRPGSQAAPPPA